MARRWWFGVGGVAIVLLATLFIVIITRDGGSAPSSRDRTTRDPGTSPPPQMEFLVTDAQCGFQNMISSDARIAAEGEFCLVTFTVANLGEEVLVMDLSCQFLLDAQGDRFSPHGQAVLLNPVSRLLFEGGLPPGSRLEDVSIYFDVPEGTTPAAVEVRTSCGASPIEIPI